MMNMVFSAAIEAKAGEALEIYSRAMQLRDRFLGYGVEATASTPRRTIRHHCGGDSFLAQGNRGA